MTNGTKWAVALSWMDNPTAQTPNEPVLSGVRIAALTLTLSGEVAKFSSREILVVLPKHCKLQPLPLQSNLTDTLVVLICGETV